jgi:hypothetical protein
MKIRQAIIHSILCLLLSNPVLSQITNADNTEIKRIYEEAENLYRRGNYSGSLEYLKREAGNKLNSSDSLLYLKIMNLQNVYGTDFNLTSDLESTLKLFLGKVNRYSFPEQKYSEVTSAFTLFQTFKEKDKRFYDSVSKEIDYTKSASLPGMRAAIANYLKVNPNSYYTKELSGYAAKIDDTLVQLELQRKKQLKDSTNRQILKDVGKKLFLTIGYSVPNGGSSLISPIQNYTNAINFYEGKAAVLGEKYAINASLAEAMINIYSGSGAKFSIDWNLFDVEYAVFDWSPNTYIKDGLANSSIIKELKAIKAGTRIGPMLTFLISKRLAAGIYYSARPGIQFLLHTAYFSETNGTGTVDYSVKPEVAAYNMTNEAGVKFYFFKRLFINPYFHFGTYKWKNSINNETANTSTKVQTDYNFKYVGLRIGF